MADALIVGTAISVVQSARSVLLPSNSSAGSPNRIELDGSLAPSPFAKVRAVLGGRDAKTALSIAIFAGNGIVGSLKALKSSARLAGHEGLVSPTTNLTISGTRISRLNLNADTNRAIRLIDGLVAQSELTGANFISSSSPNIRISTSRFGGSIDIQPQPLDSIGLNLRSIDLLSAVGAADAEARLETAINTASRRVRGLEALQRAISSGDFSNQILSGLISSTSGAALPLGSLVNVVG